MAGPESDDPAFGPPSVVGESDSTTGLSLSELDEKCLGDTGANVNKGCGFGCEFCLNKGSMTYKFDPGGELEAAGVEDPPDEWGDFVFYRTGLPQAVWEDCHRAAQPGNQPLRRTDRGAGVTFLSIQTDPYMDVRAAEITGQTLCVLGGFERPARVLTRNPGLAWQQHADRYRELAARGLGTIGASVPALDRDRVRAIEPNAPPPQRRLEGLQRFADAGVPVYVSMSPTYPTADAASLGRLLDRIADLDPTVVFHEPINPHADNFQDCVRAARRAGAERLENELARLVDADGDVRTNEWVAYAVEQFHLVHQLATERDLPIHLWPDDKLVGATQGATSDWLADWKAAQSPEPWPAHRDQRVLADAPDPPATLASEPTSSGGGEASDR